VTERAEFFLGIIAFRDGLLAVGQLCVVVINTHCAASHRAPGADG
jgi:hypothetical protein